MAATLPALVLLVAPCSAVDLGIIWWQNPPYIFSRSRTNISWHGGIDGVFKMTLDELFSLCNISTDGMLVDQVRNANALLGAYRQIADPPKTVMLLGLSADPDQDPLLLKEVEAEASFYLPALRTPGAVHFFRREDQAVGSDLLTVIIQGWPLLILILLGAGYSGIIIWLLDRLWNPANFPKPFIRGFWEGFWWAFVTMTTVGYGDTTPRSIQARIFGLIWIVVGITILSVFTATVTTVLTQESLGLRTTIQGRMIGVINGTDETRIVVTKGGHPVAYDKFKELLQHLGPADEDPRFKIRGALVEQYFFAHQQHLLGDNVLIQRLYRNPMDHGFIVASSDQDVIACVERHADEMKDKAFQLLTSYIRPLTTSSTSAAESAQTLFQPRTIMYMWYGLGAWVCVFIAFVIWEFVVWRPKHKKRKAMKKTLNTEPAHKIQSGLLPNHKHARFYANRGFVTGNPEMNSVDMEHMNEISSLENLIHWQKRELQDLQDEMTLFKSSWDEKLRQLRLKHCSQRRQLLGLLESPDAKDARSPADGGASPINTYNVQN